MTKDQEKLIRELSGGVERGQNGRLPAFAALAQVVLEHTERIDMLTRRSADYQELLDRDGGSDPLAHIGATATATSSTITNEGTIDVDALADQQHPRRGKSVPRQVREEQENIERASRVALDEATCAESDEDRCTRIFNSIHECAPDHSTQTVSVGDLRFLLGRAKNKELHYKAVTDKVLSYRPAKKGLAAKKMKRKIARKKRDG